MVCISQIHTACCQLQKNLLDSILYQSKEQTLIARLMHAQIYMWQWQWQQGEATVSSNLHLVIMNSLSS